MQTPNSLPPFVIASVSHIINSKLKTGKVLWNFPEYTTEVSNSPFHPALLSRSFVFSVSLE